MEEGETQEWDEAGEDLVWERETVSGMEHDPDRRIPFSDEITPPDHQPGLYPRWIAEHGVTDVIAGGMGQRAIDLFNEQKINVFVGAPMLKAKELVDEFLSDKLVLNANYCDH